MARMPASVVVVGARYRVELVDTDQSLGVGDAGGEDGALGWTSNARGVIRLRDGGMQSPDQLRDTLFHEVIHACSWQVGIDLEEPEVRALATSLLDTLRRNEALVDSLLEAD